MKTKANNVIRFQGHGLIIPILRARKLERTMNSCARFAHKRLDQDAGGRLGNGSRYSFLLGWQGSRKMYPGVWRFAGTPRWADEPFPMIATGRACVRDSPLC